MPWTILLRYVVRIAASLLFWRLATARRGAGYAAAPRDGGTAPPPAPPRLDRGATAVRLRESASLGWRAFAAAVLLIATALLASGGVTLTVLSPRWLGIVLLVLAAAAVTAALVELAGARTLLLARQRRLRAEALRRQVS